MVHSSRVIVGDDLSIRWSATGLISSFVELGVVAGYSWGLQWGTREIIPVGREFEETRKLALKSTLNLTVLTDKKFEMPDLFVWIEIGLLIVELENGDRWQWNRSGKYLVSNDVVTAAPDGMVQHQYALLGQGSIGSELVFIPATRQVYWEASSTAAVQVVTVFDAIELIKVL